MRARGEVLKRAALSGGLDGLPLEALKLYMLLLIRAEDLRSESRVRLQAIQRVLGRSFSQEDCRQALAVLAAHDLLTWTPVSPRPSQGQRVQQVKEGLEIVFQLNPSFE